MSLNLKSSGGGSVTVDAPSTASNYTATLPAGTGNVVVNGINGALVSETAVASTSGTSIDFTSIPSWVKRITVMFDAVSTSGTSNVIVQVGGASVETTGYSFSFATITGANACSLTTGITSGFSLGGAVATNQRTATLILTNISSNTWIASLNEVQIDTGYVSYGSGRTLLSNTLARLRVTTVNGTDTFDAGSINILYE